MALIKEIRGHKPVFGNNCFIAENATIIGDVVMGDDCSIWFNTVVDRILARGNCVHDETGCNRHRHQHQSNCRRDMRLPLAGCHLGHALHPGKRRFAGIVCRFFAHGRFRLGQRVALFQLRHDDDAGLRRHPARIGHSAWSRLHASHRWSVLYCCSGCRSRRCLRVKSG